MPPKVTHSRPLTTTESTRPSERVTATAPLATPQTSTTWASVAPASDDAFASAPVGSGPVQAGTPGQAIVDSRLSGHWALGPPVRPDYHDDNGHLQNPNDPNDPKPLPTVPPTLGDYAALAKWNAVLVGAKLLRPDLKDATAAYDHFLHGNGAPRTFDYERYLDADQMGQAVANSLICSTAFAADVAYRQLLAQDPSLASKPVTFSMTGPAIKGSQSIIGLYPTQENWEKAIGGHVLWPSATIIVTPDESGVPKFSMRLTLHAEDRYNFNPGAKDKATGIADSENGRFEQTGLGHQFQQYGSAVRDVWWAGDSLFARRPDGKVTSWQKTDGGGYVGTSD